MLKVREMRPRNTRALAMQGFLAMLFSEIGQARTLDAGKETDQRQRQPRWMASRTSTGSLIGVPGESRSRTALIPVGRIYRADVKAKADGANVRHRSMLR